MVSCTLCSQQVVQKLEIILHLICGPEEKGKALEINNCLDKELILGLGVFECLPFIYHQ